MAREKGVATAPCPNCGKELELAEQPDGGVATVSCSKCYPQATKTAVKETQKELASREVGTDTQKES